MSRADPTLLIVIGARRIDCGVMAGNAWRQESVHSIPFSPQTEGLLAALRQLPGFQSTPAANPTAVETGEPIVETGRARVDTRVDKRSAITQIKVLISEAWLPTISVPWNPACMTAATAQTYAQVQLRAAGFEFSSADEIRLDDAPYGQPRMVVAYPSVLLETLGNLARNMGARLVSVLPLGLAGGVSAQRQSPTASGLNQTGFALALIEDQQVTFVRYAGEQLLQLISRSLLHSSGEDTHLQNAEMAVWAQWQRMQLRDAQAIAIQRLHVLNLETAAAEEKDNDGWIDVDFPPDASLAAIARTPRALQLARYAVDLQHPLAARTRVQHTSTSRGRWLLAGAALTAAAVSLVTVWRTAHEVEMLQQRARAATGLAQPDRRPATLSREEKTRIVAVNAAIRQMNLPVAALLEAMPPPEDIRVALLGVDLAGQSQSAAAASNRASTLRITAEARTGEEMANYVAFLADRRPFTAAYLVRHEVMETQAEKPYRFMVEAVWQD